MPPFHEALSVERRVLRQGTFNARDAGGYPVANGDWLVSGRLFRSDALNALTGEDIQEFEQLGIRTVIDLRDAREADAAPDLIDRTRVYYERIPLFEEQLFERDFQNFPSLLDQYQIIMVEHVHQLIKVLKTVADTVDSPVLIHCTAGKDRTGLIMALVHSVLGLAPRLILQDYGASERLLDEKFEERVRALYARAALPVGILGEKPLQAPPSYLRQTLEATIARYGSISTFLDQNGFRQQERARLKSALT